MPLAMRALHYRGVRLRGGRARNLFDTFLCGCNCISCFPVVSFRKNANALPIKPRAMLFHTTLSRSLSLCFSILPLPPSFASSLPFWLKLASNAWTRGIQTNTVTAQSLMNPKSLSVLKMFSKALFSVS